MDAERLNRVSFDFGEHIEQSIFDDLHVDRRFSKGDLFHNLSDDEAEEYLRRELHDYLCLTYGAEPLTTADIQTIENTINSSRSVKYLREWSQHHYTHALENHASDLANARLEELLTEQHESVRRATRGVWGRISADLCSSWRDGMQDNEEWAVKAAGSELEAVEDYLDRLKEHLPNSYGCLLSVKIATALSDIVSLTDPDAIKGAAWILWRELTKEARATNAMLPYIEHAGVIAQGFKRYIKMVRLRDNSNEEMSDDWSDFLQLADAHECFFNDPEWYGGKCPRWNVWRPLWNKIGEDDCRDAAGIWANDGNDSHEEFWQTVCDIYHGRASG